MKTSQTRKEEIVVHLIIPKYARYLLGAILAFLIVGVAQAQDEPVNAEYAYYAIDNLILFIAAVLVMFMQAGFAMVEAGLSSYKNTVNVIFKNAFDVSIGVLLYFLIFKWDFGRLSRNYR